MSRISFSFPGRLLYAIRHSYPFSSNGYAVRTHGVAKALGHAGLEVIACTQPGLPWNQGGQQGREWPSSNVIDGVRYIHTRFHNHPGESERAVQKRIEAKYLELIEVFKPAAVMAASNWRNALPVAKAARSAKVSFFYEVRGFWEITRASLEPEWEKSSEYRRNLELDKVVCRYADQVFTLNEFMRSELIDRGIPRGKIALVPNGFDGSIEKSGDSGRLRKALGIASKFVVGYVGSFNAYEGLEDLIEAVARLRFQNVDVSLLLVGSSAHMGMNQAIPEECKATSAYRALANRLGIAEFVHFPGRSLPEDVSRYYAALDLVVLPRRPLPVCELVSPLKPLEAAVHRKPVLMSDVAPLKELGRFSDTFYYFQKGNITDLADHISKILRESSVRKTSHHGLDDLTWSHNIQPVIEALHSSANSAKMTGA